MTIFDPVFLGCPVCNSGKQSSSGYRTSAHTLIQKDLYRGYDCQHEFTLYEALKQECKVGVFGILNVFAHWQWSNEETITVGRIHNFTLPIPENIQPFSAFLTPSVPDGAEAIPFFPKVLVLGPTELAITTSAVANTPTKNIGGEMNLMIGIYGCRNKDASGWQTLLYESLTDFSEQRYALAIFKLATSAELLCDRVFELYMEKKGVTEGLTKRLLGAGRYWDARFSRTLEVCGDYLSADEMTELGSLRGPFQLAVRNFRNSFAHDTSEPPKHKDVVRAFEAAFPLFWHLDKVRGCVSG